MDKKSPVKKPENQQNHKFPEARKSKLNLSKLEEENKDMKEQMKWKIWENLT